MTTHDSVEFERDLTASLEALAPRAEGELLDRAMVAVETTPQRRRRAAQSLFAGAAWPRSLAIAGVAAVALVVGVAVGSIRGPLPFGEASPSATLTERATPSVSAGWKEPDHYSFVMDSSCSSERNFLGKWMLEVRHGAVVSAERTEHGPAIEPPPLDQIPTLGDIAARVDEAIAGGDGGYGAFDGPTGGPPIVVVETDSTDGHLTTVRINWIPNAVDDQECYAITDYEVEPTPVDESPAPPAWVEPATYRFVVNDRNCGGGERDYLGAWELTVRNREVTKSRPLDASASAHSVPNDELPTLGWIMSRVAEAQRGSSVVELETDAVDGHPTRIWIDWLPNAVDDEECYVITDYQITQPSGAGGSVDGYATSVVAGVTVVMSPQEVAALVTERMSATKRAYTSEFEAVDVDILSIDAMTYGDAMKASQNLPPMTHDDGAEVGRVVWLVAADGPFATLRGLQPGPRIGTSGYYVIDDLTGQVWAMGFAS